MKILHVVAGLPPSGGGLSELVPRLATEVAKAGHELTLATVAYRAARLSDQAERAVASGVRILRYAPMPPSGLFFSWEMFRGLRRNVAEADLVHVHSDWTFPVWWASHCALRTRKPLVMSPHGCLDPVRLAHSAWKKRAAGLLDRRYLRRATAIHATSEAERQWIERYVGGHPRIEVIPNGVDLPATKPQPKPGNRLRRVLFLGRLHPLKGLDLLLEAWGLAGRATQTAESWELMIAGPDEQGTQCLLEQQARQLGLGNVMFSGPLYEADKIRALADADIFVLPSRSENFGIVVAEALASGLPVVTTKATPWAEIDGTCGWWVEPNAEPLAGALSAAMRLTDDQRAAMGARGRAIVEETYQWARIGRAMERLYKELETTHTSSAGRKTSS